jgi:hypothetical protein
MGYKRASAGMFSGLWWAGREVVWNFIAPLSVNYKRYGMYSA